jgi:methenyltetrahydromethanopterin cyclohydrolase
MTMLSLNDRAFSLVEQVVADIPSLNIAVKELANGCRVIDFGVAVSGGLAAGLMLAQIGMAGLGRASLTQLNLDGWWLPAVAVQTDHPVLACMAAQFAGWAVSRDDYFAMGSGPARALIRAEAELFDNLGHHEEAGQAVLCLEGSTLPTPDVADYIAAKAGVPVEKLTLLIAPTASLAGGLQVAARVVETGLHKLYELGFDLPQVVSAFGTCPLPPVAKNDLLAIGRANDAILYGGQVHYTVRTEDATLEAVVPQIPASTSSDYGAPFYEVFKAYNFDFYQVDPLLFSPAEIFVTNASSGRTFHAGHLNADVLRRSFLG